MKLIFLVAGSRAGSDFFQGFLDGHSQILQFPGLLNENIFELFNESKSENIAEKFIKIYPYFFNSKLSIRERHDCLGENKKKYYKVSKKKFIDQFKFLMKNQIFSNYKIIKNLHLAYVHASKQKKVKKKIILLHTHHFLFTRLLINRLSYKNLSIIFTYRHPVASLNSSVKNWLRFKNGSTFFPRGYYFQLNVITKGILNLTTLKKKVFLVQLEKLHRENTRVLRDFCRIFKIKYEKSMRRCTFHGLKWWGDSVSRKWINGINANFENKIDKDYFFDRDIRFLENLCSEIVLKYKYKNFSKKKNIMLNLLPMKSEILVWKNTFFHFFKGTIGLNFKTILSIPYFYFKRIFYINKFTMKNKSLPYSIGSR